MISLTVTHLLFSLLFVLHRSGSQAAGAPGCQHPGREDGEPDADSGEWPGHGQHHLPELHGLPGGDSEGKYSAQEHQHAVYKCTSVYQGAACVLGS